MAFDAFVSNPAKCFPHDAGWFALKSGGSMTRLPFWDTSARLFARLGPGSSAKLLAGLGMRLPTTAEYNELHASGLHIEPYTMPTAAMLKKDGIPASNTAAIDAYRNARMRSKAWCEQHDAEVFVRLALANWQGQHVDNAGKHWAMGGIIYGWWLKAGGMIQPASTFHASNPDYTDYATTFHAVIGGPPPKLQGPPGGTMRPSSGALNARCAIASALTTLGFGAATWAAVEYLA